MLAAFSRDSDSSYCLTDFLILNELAQLVGSCSLWRRWILASRTLSGRYRELSPTTFPLFARCEWTRQHVQHLEITIPVVAPKDQADSDAQVTETFQMLPLFRRLQGLQITSRGQPIADSLFERCFTTLGSTLTRLEFHLPIETTDAEGCSTDHNDALVQSCITHARHLHALQDLYIRAYIPRPALLDLSPLSALPLCYLRIGRPANDFCLTAEQTSAICAIRTLMTVDLGSWVMPEHLPMVNGNTWREASHLIDRGIGAFLRSRVGASPLRFLQLSRTLMTPELFDCLCTVPTIESIWPKRWRGGMSADQWRQLRCFTNLGKQSVCPEEGPEALPIDVSDVIQGLGRCTTLAEIQLGSGFLLHSTHVEQLVANLPSLECLVLFRVQVESLSPLSHAPSLTALDLRECTDLQGGPARWRLSLPALAGLTDLAISDLRRERLRPSEAETLNRGLFERMPKLTKAKLIQNLLREDD